MKNEEITRREFVKTAAATAATVGLGASLLPSRVMGANDRINIGVIGVGGMGYGHLDGMCNAAEKGEENLNVVAVCDIYEPRKEGAKARCGGEVFHDYRKLLERKDIDAVLIASPDHWHSRMTIDALEAGKDVYCEKPMTHTWEEAKEVYHTVQRTGRVLQVGSQGCSEDRWQKAHDLIASGAIGKLVWSQTSICRNSKEGEWDYYGIDLNAGPHNLDWDAFLGPATKRPLDLERYFRWRKYWDYSGGIATDLFAHVLHALFKAIGPEFPNRVVSGGGIFIHKNREVPDTFHVLMDFPSNHSVVCMSSMCNEQGTPVVVRGHEATMQLSGGDIVVQPERIFAEEREVLRVPTRGASQADHRHNWLECIRTREKPACDVELAYKTMVAIDLSTRSFREGKVMRFDPEKQEMLT
ncbi:MAG: Gfo/Idh/MocA family oxidoreductase [Armatimonadetes bacterium]|nr:Gfo/Idh/MocA family oxidoreductase [Armatimonadota bacterium]